MKRHRVKINDNSRLTKLHAKERAFVTSHVNIFLNTPAENESIVEHCINVSFFIMLESK